MRQRKELLTQPPPYLFKIVNIYTSISHVLSDKGQERRNCHCLQNRD